MEGYEDGTEHWVLTRGQRKELFIVRDMLRAIRETHEHLDEEEGGCALWIKREWVRSVHHQHKPVELSHRK